MRLKITVEDKTYEVDVEVAEPESNAGVRYVGAPSRGSASPVSGPIADATVPTANESNVCRSPLAGVVSEVNVKPGDEVTFDQSIIVLEAMKMFTTITSPVAGKVTKVHVAQTDAVKQGQVLVEFE